MVGHHGSKYSSQQDFLSALTPEAAIISVGDNSYGHPHRRGHFPAGGRGRRGLPHRYPGLYHRDRTLSLTREPHAMAAERAKPQAKNAAYDRLRKAIKEKSACPGLSVFTGRATCARPMSSSCRTSHSQGSEDFNLHRLSGSRVTTQDVADAVESMPMMAPSTLVTVTDWDIFRLDESQRSQLTELLEDLPDYCTVVFIYDTVPYKPDRKRKSLTAAIDKNVEVVEFQGNPGRTGPLAAKALPCPGPQHRPANGGLYTLLLRLHDG